MAQVDGTGNPIVNHSFSLSTDQGMITAGGVTDANGMGTGTLTNPDAVTGVFTVTATLGELSTATTVNYLALIPDSLIAEADVTSLLADGEASTTVTATVFDPNGNPVSGLPLVFATDQGTIWPLDATTDSLGQASATLTSVPSGTDLSAQVVVQSALDASIADTVTVAYRGITVDLTAASHYLVADGLSSTSLSALITESTSGNPVSASTVTWSTTLGVVPSFSVTSALGIATTTFLAGTTPGTAVITANLTSGLTDTVHVNLAQPHDSTLVVSWYNPGGNPTNGTEQLTVTAIFADANAYPIDSVMVNFSLDPATMGVIQSPVMTNVNGVATTSLIYSTQYAGEVLRIWARSNNISGYVDVTLPEAN
jgi:adhesin/invasin